jgi:hypothetical protein
MQTLLLIIVILIVIGMFPVWPHAHALGWGYYPSGLGLVVLIVLILALMGKI